MSVTDLTTPPAPRTLELNCWVLGDDPDKIFTVEMQDTRNVSALKDLIKEKKPVAFQRIDASDINVWNVSTSVPLDGHLRENAKGHTAHKRHLHPAKRMLGLFPDPLKEQELHIIIQPPPVALSRLTIEPPPELALNCWVLHDDHNRVFSVRIPDDHTVGDLKKAVKKEKPVTFQHVDADAIDLWKASASIAVDKNLEEHVLALDLGNTEMLSPVDQLSEIFPDPLVRKNLHVVIRASLVTSPAPELPGAPNVQTLRHDYLSKVPARAPSMLGSPSQFMKHQAKSERAIYCNRPPNASHPIPVMLLHPVFGQFVDDCAEFKLTEEVNQLELQLAHLMSNYNQDENDRAEAIRGALRGFGIDLTQTVIEGTKYTTDGDLQHKGHRYVIAEIKNEIGCTGVEPYAQAILYYLESTRKHAAAHPGSVLPSILVLIFGPFIGFAGAAWNTRPNAQMLATVLTLDYHASDQATYMRAARHLGALKNAVESLQTYYKSQLATESSNAVYPEMFPYPRKYWSLENDRSCSFQYLSPMAGGNLVFRGQLDDGREVCVKFAPRYCREAHEFCASNGFAPTLFGYEKIPGGWHMVVMEHLGGDYVQFDRSLVHENMLTDFRANIVRLHQAGYVHGDIRDTNTMVPRSGKGRIKLVDFDWAGHPDSVLYPARVRRGSDLWRPEGAQDLKSIKSDHDIQMLDEMFGITQEGQLVVH